MNIRLEGDCTVQRSAEILAKLRQAMVESKDVLTLSFSQVEDADLSFFQLIEATHLSCEAASKRLLLQADLPQHLARYANLTGFSTIVGPIEQVQVMSHREAVL